LIGLLVAAFLGVGLMAASASAADTSSIIYQVNPLMQPSGLTSPATLTNPFCSSGSLVCYTPNDIKAAYNYPIRAHRCGPDDRDRRCVR
jgi:hypothetical protein